jgi:hypothetical protein
MTDASNEDAMLNRTSVIAASMALVFIVQASAQEKLVGTYGEARTSLAFNIPDATVQKLLPQGWLASPFSAGPAKGANLVVTFMDWLVVQDPDGKPTNTYSHVGLTVPAKQNGTEATVAMVVAGLSAPPGYAPGPYRNFGAAKSIIARTLRIDDDGVSRAEESWQFEGESGDTIQLQLQFVRGTARRSKLEAEVHSAMKPEFYRIYRIDEAVDVVRSADSGTDRVQKYLFKASGPQFSALLNGSEQLVSITSFPWFSRQAFLPVSQAK